MSELKDYTCKSCGGALIVDISQIVHECPFCGTLYVDEDELLKEAYDSLRRTEYADAKEKFKQVLERNPNCTRGLLGTILLKGRVNMVEHLSDVNRVSQSNLPKMKSMVDQIMVSATEEQKQYFTKFDQMLNKAQTYWSMVDTISDMKNHGLTAYKRLYGTQASNSSLVKEKDKKIRKAEEKYSKAYLPYVICLVGAYASCYFFKINKGLKLALIIGGLSVIGVLFFSYMRNKYQGIAEYFKAENPLLTDYRRTLTDNESRLVRYKDDYVKAYQEWRKLDKAYTAKKADSHTATKGVKENV